MWTATRQAAKDALEAFLPRAGREYASSRNYDLGPDARDNVSRLSPWIRLRLLTEKEVIDAARERHGKAADKFVQEVLWRTYWKGWLQLRPSVWRDYREAVEKLRADPPRKDEVHAACAGGTGIECFDAWAKELVDRGYLHNHSRMWFASIWVHSLRLPWELGADFFLRHLIDGDPASNTLSWRWVAGLHTRGKQYLARADNIRKYTDGRFDPDTDSLASEAVEWKDLRDHPKPRTLPDLGQVPATGRSGLLLGEDDLSSPGWSKIEGSFAGVAGFFPAAEYERLEISRRVRSFRREALANVVAAEGGPDVFEQPSKLVDWAKSRSLDRLVLAEPAVGIWDSVTPELQFRLKAGGIELRLLRNPWDEERFPLAKGGFFAFHQAVG